MRNPGAAFSIATGMTWVLSLIAAGVVVAIIWIVPRLRSAGWAVGLGLVLAGALGNLSDRVFRAPAVLQGHVVDFISLFEPDGRGLAGVQRRPTRRSASAARLIVLLALLGKDYDGTSSKSSKETTV